MSNPIDTSSYLKAPSGTENGIKDSLLGDYITKSEPFPALDNLIDLLLDKDFLIKKEIERWSAINQFLLDWILNEKEPAFLLPQIVDFISEVAKAKVLHGTYTINSFELWLNQYSNAGEEEQFLVRSKIAGKKLPRSSYQVFFPIGRGKTYFGSHIVTAHTSPDIDTTVASFFGWLDAFAARVGTGLHTWNLPGFEPPSLIHQYLGSWLGEGYLSALSISSETLFLRAMDLIQKPLREQDEKPNTKINEILLARSRFEEIEQKIQFQDLLTICCLDHNGYSPIGTVSQAFLSRDSLGTVSLRDFSNTDEVKIPSYLQVISVIDHHRTSLNTMTPAQISISDAQSANVLLAEMAFAVNDPYSSLSTKEQLEEQLEYAIKDRRYGFAERVLKLLKGRDAAFYVHPKREYLEYRSFLIAILDDTDLLVKASERDLFCVAELLNRMKSLQLNEAVEAVHLDDIPLDEHFIKRATRRLLCNEELYSLYAKDFSFREAELGHQLIQGLRGENLRLFSDTKELAKYARVGQIKFFANNFQMYLDYSNSLRRIWLREAINQMDKNCRLKLHLQMISTISGAQEAFFGEEIGYSHLDELWMWLPWNDDEAVEIAKEFMAKFSLAPEWNSQTLEAEIIGEQCDRWVDLISHYFPCSFRKQEVALDRHSIAVLRFKPGLLNSRKASIAPYLPLNMK